MGWAGHWVQGENIAEIHVSVRSKTGDGCPQVPTTSSMLWTGAKPRGTCPAESEDQVEQLRDCHRPWLEELLGHPSHPQHPPQNKTPTWVPFDCHHDSQPHTGEPIPLQARGQGFGAHKLILPSLLVPVPHQWGRRHMRGPQVLAALAARV